MIRKCLGCGCEKDTSVNETYPYDGEYDSLVTNEPIEPLLVMECQVEFGPWKAAVMCHECWHRMCVERHGMDMWIGQDCWDSISPVTPVLELPVFVPGKHHAEEY